MTAASHADPSEIWACRMLISSPMSPLENAAKNTLYLDQPFNSHLDLNVHFAEN